MPLLLPKPRPRALEKGDRRRVRETTDQRESAKVKARAQGRCEVIIVGEGRCTRRDVHTHHLIGGWGRRNRGPSILAAHKLRTCARCHSEITTHVLVSNGSDTAARVRYTRRT